MLRKTISYLTYTMLYIGAILTLYSCYVYVTSYNILQNTLVKYNSPMSTQVFDRKGDLIANIFDKEHRLFVPYKDIPTSIIETLIATEDTLFFEHNGINTEAIARAIVKDIKAMKLVEGASTITQQLIRTSLLTRKKTFDRKIKEIMMSLRLETMLNKKQILERYLNEISFGHNYFGIKTASNGYFRKELNELTLKEIAMLVGIPKAPSIYAPTRHYDKSIKRANHILIRLKSLGWIDSHSFIQAFNEKPIVYNDSLTKNKAPYVIDYLKKLASKNLKDLKTGGYVFELSIDLSLQKIARDALRYGLKKIDKRISESNITAMNLAKDANYTSTLNGAIVSIENSTGKILALVGGVDYKKSKFNRVTQAFRQPGSSIKPFIYQLALDSGYGLNTNLIDITRTYEYQKNDENLTWRPKNYEDNVKGLIKLQEALIHSRNLATINLVSDLGLDKVYQGFLDFGFKKVPHDLSISLGSFGISPIELAGFYSIFSNYGQRVTPMLITKIKKIGYDDIEFSPQKTLITSEQQAFLSIEILKNTVRRGTGRNAYLRNIEIAGKTGTTNNNADAWFCGFSPTVETIVWYGNDDSTPMDKKETGGKSAAPAFRYFYKEMLKIYPHITRKFTIPEDVYKKDKYYFTKTSPLEKENIRPSDTLVF